MNALLVGVILSAIAASTSGLGQLTFLNNCGENIWINPQSTAGLSFPSSGPTTGIQMVQQNQQVTYTTTSAGFFGQFWVKSRCDDAQNGQSCTVGQSLAGPNGCGTYGCGPPANTVAVFNFPATGNQQYLIDVTRGFSYPMQITPTTSTCDTTSFGLSTASCPLSDVIPLDPVSSDVQCLSPCAMNGNYCNDVCGSSITSYVANICSQSRGIEYAYSVYNYGNSWHTCTNDATVNNDFLITVCPSGSAGPGQGGSSSATTAATVASTSATAASTSASGSGTECVDWLSGN